MCENSKYVFPFSFAISLSNICDNVYEHFERKIITPKRIGKNLFNQLSIHYLYMD